MARLKSSVPYRRPSTWSQVHCMLHDPRQWGEPSPSTAFRRRPARVPNLRVCKHLCRWVAPQVWKGEVWYRLVGWRKRRAVCRTGKWPPRGTRTTVLILDKTVGSQCGDTSKASASVHLLDLRWRSIARTAPGSLSTGSPAGRTPTMETAQSTVRPT